MIFSVKTRNEVEGKAIFLEEDFVMISITCVDDPVKMPEYLRCKDILHLEFDDIDAPRHILGDLKYKPFSSKDAKAILEFYGKHKDQYKYMIVHCDAGISRSPAVACALTKIDGGFDNEMFRRFIPNRRVYSMILGAYYLEEENDQWWCC